MIHQEIIFTESECASIIEKQLFEYKKWENYDRKYFSSDIFFSEENYWIFERLEKFFEGKTSIPMEITRGLIHFHKYDTGCWFGKHNDARDRRIFSIGTILNQGFKGGEFVFYEKEELTIQNITGNSYIFDSSIFHEVKKITDGVRYSLIWFIRDNNIIVKTEKII